MKRRLVSILLTLLALGVVWVALVYLRSPTSQTEADSGENAPAISARAIPDRGSVASAKPEGFDPTSEDEPVPEQPPSAAVLPNPKPLVLASVEELPSGPEVGEADSSLPPATVLENMRTTFRQYQLRFHENPVGDNAEITRALNGGNPGQVIFVRPDDGMRVNQHGELVDNWGTPYFFHQLSRTEMEIRCAGPDRRMWTADDLALK